MTHAPAQAAAEFEPLGTALRLRFATIRTQFSIAQRTLELLHPRSADDLLDEATIDEDDRLPYWAEIWPSSLILAERVATLAGSGRRCLELGCGVGLLTLTALRAGFDVVATDYFQEAVEFTRYNAALNLLAQPTTRLADWRRWPTELGRFDFVFAADVLYERGNLPLVAGVLAETISIDGIAWIADPGRPPAARFPEECQRHGLTAREIARVGIDHAGRSHTVQISEVRRGPA